MALTDLEVIHHEFFATGLQIVALSSLQTNTNIVCPEGSEKLHICILPTDSKCPAVGYAYSDDPQEGKELAKKMAEHMVHQISVLSVTRNCNKKRKLRK